MMQPGPPWPRERGVLCRGRRAGELATERTQLSLGSRGGRPCTSAQAWPPLPERALALRPPLSPSYARRRSAWGRSWLSAPRRSGLTESPR